MAAIQNERTLRLQATVPRILPVKIPIDDVEGLPEALEEVGNGAKRLVLESDVGTFIESAPTAATLTATREGGLTGAISWAVIAGTATISGSGDTRTVTAASIPIGGRAVIRVTCDSYLATVVLTRTSALAAQNQISLASQVTGSLAAGNVSGLGALALLNTVNLNTQVSGALNGITQVNYLGTLAYADGLAANQIGAGTLAAGVIYAGTIAAQDFSGKTFTGGSFIGSSFATAAAGPRIEMFNFGSNQNALVIYNASNALDVSLRGGGGSFVYANASSASLALQNYGAGAALAATGYTGPAAIFTTTSTASAHIRLPPKSSVPTDKTAGNIATVSGHGLCISDGSNWYRIATDPTPIA